jgi:hypothetical protein
MDVYRGEMWMMLMWRKFDHYNWFLNCWGRSHDVLRWTIIQIGGGCGWQRSGLVWQPLFPPGSRCFPCVANPCAKFPRTIAPSCLETGPMGILAHSEPNLRVETRPTFRRRAAIPESRIVSSSRLLCHGRTRRHHSASRRAPLRQWSCRVNLAPLPHLLLARISFFCSCCFLDSDEPGLEAW